MLALLAEGTWISTLTRVKRIKEDTTLHWLREAVQHADKVNAVLMQYFHLKRAQLGGLWSFVDNKGEKISGKHLKRHILDLNFAGCRQSFACWGWDYQR